METRQDLLNRLNDSASQLLVFSKNVTAPDSPMYEGWTVKRTLGHIMFWHESFARNVRDLADGVKPKPLSGAYSELNRRCFEELETMTFEEVIGRFEAAHDMINRYIMDDKLVLIPYRVGSRSYSPEEHLEIVSQHIQEHLKALKTAVRRSAK
ncbi:MAG: DinB family protein [Dehalogenimonas sp.]|uniref:DinB family protein n=1 Tax=Candidatus Dehalogenimonas loeffleri TaxID=3127115 RepID=A0ABZ2J429_9CHLR|nr:DinB family protein [Dehalogenimonas sp.]